MRQHNMWYVYVRSAWRGVPDCSKVRKVDLSIWAICRNLLRKKKKTKKLKFILYFQSLFYFHQRVHCTGCFTTLGHNCRR